MQPGESFELEVKASLEDALSSGNLGVLPHLAKVFHKKAYPSITRRGSVIIDVSVEYFLPSDERPWLVAIWECKDYGHPVPVDDVEEFHAKLEGLGVHKMKGVMASRSGFQSGARDFARTQGIDLVRILADGSPILLMEGVRSTLFPPAEQALVEADTTRLTSMFYALTSSGESAGTLDDLLAYQLAIFRRMATTMNRSDNRPRFALNLLASSRTPRAFRPEFRCSQLGGEPTSPIFWRYRGPRTQGSWKQVALSHLSRMKMIGDFDLTGLPNTDELVETNELGIELRFYWSAGLSYELHRWKLNETSTSEADFCEIGDEILPILQWDDG